MSIHDKFDTVLKTNKLGVNSIFGLEKHCGVGVGSVSKYLSSGESPKLGTIKKIQDVMKINPEWWDTGKGDIFLTSVPKADDNNEKQEIDGTWDMIEKSEKYTVVPTIILDKYEILSNREIESRETTLQEVRATMKIAIEAKDQVIAIQQEEIAELREKLKTLAPSQNTH